MHDSSPFSLTDVIFLVFSSVSVALMFLLGNEIGPGSLSSTIFQSWFSVTLIFLLKRMKYTTQIFSPSFLAFIYLGLSYVCGSSIPQEYHVWLYNSALGRIEDFSLINGYLLICLSTIAVVSALELQCAKRVMENIDNRAATTNVSLIFTSLFALIVSAFIDHYLMFGVRFGLAVIITVNLARMRDPTFKAFGFAALLMVFLISSFQNKREIILIIFLVSFTYSFTSQARLNFRPKNILIGTLIVGFLFIAILAASISRGYGNFETGSPLESVLLVGNYVSSPFFFRYFLENVEIVHTYASTVIAVDFAARGDIPLQAGATFIKPLFLPIPRDLFPLKPESAITIFTTAVDPEFAATGNSLPVTIPAEAFINFHFAGPFFLVIIFLALERIFRAALRAQAHRLTLRGYSAIVFATLPLIMVRGGGFDLFVLTFLLSLPSYTLAAIFLAKKDRSMQYRSSVGR